MVKIILLLSCVFTTFCSGVDRSAALAFEESVRKAFGVLAPFPEEIRKRCTGPVQQKITVAEDDTISITISFRCKPLIEEGKTAKDQLVTSKKTFS